jgi:hypothetical protein
MKGTGMIPPDSETEDAVTGLPGLRTWRGVYYFVAGTFVLWVILLNLLTRMFP